MKGLIKQKKKKIQASIIIFIEKQFFFFNFINNILCLVYYFMETDIKIKIFIESNIIIFITILNTYKKTIHLFFNLIYFD